MLRCIQRIETDPRFNLAAEEYLLQNARCDTFMLWRNEQSVIIGKHQNMAREINHEYITEHNIPVVRRITGGGTVYHDPGNINFSFIRLNRKENPVDFRFFTRPVILFLKSMGLPAEFEGKSNILVHGKKVSGNAAHIFKGRVLHHGTLLFDTDLGAIEKALRPEEERYTDRSVRSAPREVTNISAYIGAAMSTEDFVDAFFSFVINFCPDSFHDRLTAEETNAITELAAEKYHNSSWNVCYSPDYQFSNSWESDEGRFSITLKATESLISDIRIDGPDRFSEFISSIEKALKNVLHEKINVSDRLKSITFTGENEAGLLNQIIRHMF